MTRPCTPSFTSPDAAAIAAFPGRIAVFADPEAGLSVAARRIDRAMRGALSRATAEAGFAKLAPGEGMELSFPAGLAAKAVHLIRLGRRSAPLAARKAGATAGKGCGAEGLMILAGRHPDCAEIALGSALGAQVFDRLRREPATIGEITLAVADPEGWAERAAPMLARAGGLALTRELVNEPANELTTTAFADRLAALADEGLTVEVMDEARLAEIGMRLLLGVAQGSEHPPRVVAIEWRGGPPEAAPLVVAGKGVVFDTGGISLKQPSGMEEMTTDMGGAAVVAGLMRTLAARKAKANVVGIVGLVENMPDGRAQRPGDIVRSLKGDTVEVINTDAEGRLVLADVMWYAQSRWNPAAVIDLATLTGAIIVALGHEKAGLFANDERLAGDLLAAAEAEGEGLWRMPLGPGYDKALKSPLADMRNVGGRPAGAVTAAQFLQRFVRDGMPWAHLDVAGVVRRSEATDFARKGPTGWGVMTLDRLVAARFETR